LGEAPEALFVKAGTAENEDPAGCKGTVAAPQAEAGKLCIFEKVGVNNTAPLVLVPEGTGEGAGKSGAVLLLAAEKAGGEFVLGDWVVTG
jgi:hypothetical protein